MRKDRGRWIGLAAAVPIGVVLAFFFVFAPLFTDGPGSPFDFERLASFGLTFGLFLGAAALSGWISRGDWWSLGALGLPGIGMAAWYASTEPGVVGLAVAYALLVLAALFLGRTLGLRLRRRGAAGVPA